VRAISKGILFSKKTDWTWKCIRKCIAWWQAHEGRWPNLTKMVKQYFASPASSAGVERVFSAAGKMHSDLKKSSKDETLEASLFAMQNTD
jgi:hypothetical protein